MALGYQCCALCATTSWSTSASTEQPCPSGCPWWVRTGLLWLLKAPPVAGKAGFVRMTDGTVSGDSPQKCRSLWAPPELPLKLSFVEVSLCSGLIQFCIINTLESLYNWWGPDIELSWVVAGDILLLEIKRHPLVLLVRCSSACTSSHTCPLLEMTIKHWQICAAVQGRTRPWDDWLWNLIYQGISHFSSFSPYQAHQLVLPHLGALRNAESPTSLGSMRIKVV